MYVWKTILIGVKKTKILFLLKKKILEKKKPQEAFLPLMVNFWNTNLIWLNTLSLCF